MTTNPHDHHATPDEQGRRAPEPEPDPEPDQVRQTPEAIEAGNVRREGQENGGATLEADPAEGEAAEAEQQNQTRRARGVEWVRPTDLINRNSAALAGRGIDLEVDLTRKSREKIGAGMRYLGERARNLPPLSSFGRGHRHDAPTRAAVGKS
ncbi:hypothetical protein ACP6NG_10990 [Brevibacterium casei]|uniref:hypothetical protein n=1 Tax=Brevibacterium casei TaxID=33889 RepID=UPI003F7E93B3